MLTAYDLETGQPVEIGATVTNFRGETGTLTQLTRPNSEGRDGKVIARNGREVYARVWGLRVEYTDTREPITNPVHDDPFAGIPGADG